MKWLLLISLSEPLRPEADIIVWASCICLCFFRVSGRRLGKHGFTERLIITFTEVRMFVVTLAGHLSLMVICVSLMVICVSIGHLNRASGISCTLNCFDQARKTTSSMDGEIFD